MKRIRLLFITSGATAGGTEQQLVNFLRQYDRKRFECRVLTVLAADSTARRGGVDFRPLLKACGVHTTSLDQPEFPTIRGILALRRAIRVWPAEIVQTYGLRVDLIVRFLPRGPGMLIGSIRGSEEQRSDWLFRLDGLTSWRLRGYVSNSQCGKLAIVRRAGVNSHRVIVIPNGVETRLILNNTESRRRLRREWGAEENDVLVLTVANLHAAKGHEDIIRAAAMIPRSYSIRFVFAGEDHSQGRLEFLARTLGVRDRILFLGHRSDVPDLLAASDVFLLASHWEGMSNALMEAMNAGKAIIATRVGAAEELLDGGRYGQLIPRQEPDSIALALYRFKEANQIYRRQAAKARERIQNFYTIPAMIKAYERFYERLIRQPKGFVFDADNTHTELQENGGRF